jgi:hypothetical protein
VGIPLVLLRFFGRRFGAVTFPSEIIYAVSGGVRAQENGRREVSAEEISPADSERHETDGNVETLPVFSVLYECGRPLKEDCQQS